MAMQQQEHLNTPTRAQDTAIDVLSMPTLGTPPLCTLTLTLEYALSVPHGPQMVPLITWLYLRCVSKWMHRRFAVDALPAALAWIRQRITGATRPYITRPYRPHAPAEAVILRSYDYMPQCEHTHDWICDEYAVGGPLLTNCIEDLGRVASAACLTICVPAGSLGPWVTGVVGISQTRVVGVDASIMYTLPSTRGYNTTLALNYCSAPRDVAERHCVWVLHGPRLVGTMPLFCPPTRRSVSLRADGSAAITKDGPNAPRSSQYPISAPGAL